MESDAQLDRITVTMREDMTVARIIPDFAALVRQLVAQADRTPLTAGPDRITGFDLRLLVSGLMGRRAGIERLPALFGPAAQGDFAPIAAAVAEDVRQGDVSAMGAVMDCASWASVDRLAAIRRQSRRSMLGTASDFPLPEWCPDWRVPPLPAAFRQPVQSDVPTLFIAGDLDGQTPPANAEAVRQGFRNGRLFVVHRAGHDSSLFLSSPALFDGISRFLSGEDVRDGRFDAPPLTFASTYPKARP